MKALEFQTRLNPDRTLTVPSEVAQEVPAGQSVRVILLISESREDQDWARLTAEQFVQGYSEDDAIYDKLPTG
ncbi:hypothetical protein HYR54_05525 [Candidatus Acetothermia bacterium]|nr:hypothetical protein [Candidatus Acetothermia bacterium]MBI3660709.1 hypothetical protein [Candidatus Acetothermia bacterium]